MAQQDPNPNKPDPVPPVDPQEDAPGQQPDTNTPPDGDPGPGPHKP